MLEKKFPLILTLIITGDVDRSEFEPDAEWVKITNSTYRVTQRVRQSGSYLMGRTDAYQETFSEVLGDDRFVSLVHEDTL